MLLTPRYGDVPVMAIGTRTAGDHPVLRQRHRLESLLGDLSEDEWHQPSRCAGWSVQDVVTHLASTNDFWALSIRAGVAGEPTRFLGAFDPAATPAQMVDGVRGTSVAETMQQLATSTSSLTALVEGLDAEAWDALAEAPPGHLPVRLVADHALWDCWVHERDIVLPLGRPAVIDRDEVLTSLRYAAALGRALELCAGRSEPGTVVLEVGDPDAIVAVTVDADAVRVHDGPVPDDVPRAAGHAVDMLEMLSARDAGVPVPAAVRALAAGLSVVFDQA